MIEVFKKKITSPYSHIFDLLEGGLYALSIKASCNPGWRNKWWKKFAIFLEDTSDLHLDDEDLRVEIDGVKFGKPNGKHGLFNSPAAFSGTSSLGKIKTVVFLINLKKGAHKIDFIPHRSAYLEGVTVEKFEESQKAGFYQNAIAENENYYSWYTFALVNLPLKSISISASADVSSAATDDDDIKVIIDAKVRKNPLSRHKDSFFCGFTLQGEEHYLTEELDLGAGVHYVELLADKTPTLLSVKFDLSLPQAPISIGSIRPYRLGPNGEDYNRLDTLIEKEVEAWNKQFFSQVYPPPKLLDPDLVKAIIYVESTIGYGYGEYYPAYPDVMQVGNPSDPAIHTLKNDGWVDPKTGVVARENEWVDGYTKVLEYKEADVKSVEDSIKWGIRWLYHKVQYIEEGKRQWFSWEEAVRRYNGGGDPNYFDKVNKIYRNGRTLGGVTLWILLGFIVLSTFALAYNLYSRQGEFFITRESLGEKGAFQFSVNVLSGLRLIKYPVSRYFSRGGDFMAFYKPKVEVRNLGTRSSGVKVLAVTGRNIADYEIIKILEYNGREFKLRQKIGDFGAEEDGFDGDAVLIGGLVGDVEPGVSEWHHINYTNAPDQLWISSYDFDNDTGTYKFTDTEKNILHD